VVSAPILGGPRPAAAHASKTQRPPANPTGPGLAQTARRSAGVEKAELVAYVAPPGDGALSELRTAKIQQATDGALVRSSSGLAARADSAADRTCHGGAQTRWQAPAQLGIRHWPIPRPSPAAASQQLFQLGPTAPPRAQGRAGLSPTGGGVTPIPVSHRRIRQGGSALAHEQQPSPADGLVLPGALAFFLAELLRRLPARISSGR